MLLESVQLLPNQRSVEFQRTKQEEAMAAAILLYCAAKTWSPTDDHRIQI